MTADEGTVQLLKFRDLLPRQRSQQTTSTRSEWDEVGLSLGISPGFFFYKSLVLLCSWWRFQGGLKRGVEYTFHP
jgi:hypothetical protein